MALKEVVQKLIKGIIGIDFILFKRNTWVCPNFIESVREKNPDGFDTNPYSDKKECSNNVTGLDKQNKVILWREI